MRITEKTPAREIHQRALRLYWMRLGAVACLLVAYVLAAKVGGFETPLLPLYILAACEIVFNFPYPFYFCTSENGFKYLAASVMSDFMVETLVLHFIGGVDAMFFSAIYLLSILYCALNLPSIFNFLMATLASFLYAGLIAAEYYGIIPHVSTVGLTLTGFQQMAMVISHVAFFYLIALFARFLTDALIEKEKRMAQLVNDLREANQRIKYAHRLKAEFIAHLSHELRAPLNNILGFVNLLKQDEVGVMNDKQRNGVSAIERSGKHLLELINDVLDISKLEAKKSRMDWTDADLVDIVCQMCDVFHEEAMRKQIRLKMENKTGGTLLFQMDVRKVRQILYNLLSNAIKFTPIEGEVTVHLEKTPQGMVMSVCDSGIGIAAEDQARIFDAYEQVGCHRFPEMNGTGLGLSITKQFVEMHDGKIEVQSQANRGSKFKVTFPAKLATIAPLPNSRIANAA